MRAELRTVVATSVFKSTVTDEYRTLRIFDENKHRMW